MLQASFYHTPRGSDFFKCYFLSEKSASSLRRRLGNESRSHAQSFDMLWILYNCTGVALASSVFLPHFSLSPWRRSLLLLRPQEAMHSLPSQKCSEMAGAWAFLRYCIIKSDMSEGIQTNNSRRKIRVSVCLGLSLAQLKLHRGIISHVADGSSVGGRSLALLWEAPPRDLWYN